MSDLYAFRWSSEKYTSEPYLGNKDTFFSLSNSMQTHKLSLVVIYRLQVTEDYLNMTQLVSWCRDKNDKVS